MTVLDELADQRPPDWVQKGRGGFLRVRQGFGAPQVTDPDGATVKHAGLKADLLALCADRGIETPEKATVAQLHELLGPAGLKWQTYGSPSSFGDLIDDPEAVVQYDARMALRGLAEAMANGDPIVGKIAELRGADPDDKDFKNTARQLFGALQTLGGGDISADRGTLVHAAINAKRLGDDWRTATCDEFPDALANVAVNQLGLTIEAVDAAVTAFFALVADAGLEILVMEAPCVNDTYRQAGTLDCLARCTRDLIVDDLTIPAGTVLVLDIKTGKMRT